MRKNRQFLPRLSFDNSITMLQRSSSQAILHHFGEFKPFELAAIGCTLAKTLV
jgi:hypothetical protein